MTARLVVRILLLLTALAPPSCPGEISAKLSLAKHSLWKVAGDGHTVYLLGSIHLLKREDFPLPEIIEAAYRQSELVVFETDFAKMEDPKTQQTLAAKALLPPGETLRQEIAPVIYSRLSEYTRSAGLAGDAFDHLKPSFAAVTLESLALRKLGFDPEFGLDLYFFQRAQKRHKPIVPLESVEFQMDLLTQCSPEEGELLLKTTLDEIANLRVDFGEMLRAWKTGDTDTLEKLINRGMRQAPALLKRLVTDRNHRWLPKIEEILRGKQNAIVIVGAGHLVGPEGVVELLRKQGFPIQQE